MRRGPDQPGTDLGRQVLDWIADQQLVMLTDWQARVVLDMYGSERCCEGPETVADAVAGT